MGELLGYGACCLFIAWSTVISGKTIFGKIISGKAIFCLYHSDKANVVADALSRKAVRTSAMITTQERLQDEMKRAGIDVVVKGGNV